MYSVYMRQNRIKTPCKDVQIIFSTLIDEYGDTDTCIKICLGLTFMCTRNFVKLNKQTRRVNSISSCSLSVFGAGVGVTVELEFLCR